jgi:fructose PTS system EIIBC or EIIC component
LAEPAAVITHAGTARLAGRLHESAEQARPDLVVSPLTATSKVAALKELVDQLHRRGAVADGLQFLQSVLAREGLQSTVVADAVALPHARCHSVLRLAAAVGVAHSPLEYASGDEMRHISVICLIAVPTRSPGLYLEWMGTLARRLSQPAIRSRLAAAVTAEDVNELLGGAEPLAGAAGHPPRASL